MLRLALLFASFAVISAQTAPDKMPQLAGRIRSEATGRLISDKFHSQSLEGNLLGDNPERSVLIYLPPTYDRNAAKRYPVIYLLHGYGADPQHWVNGRFQGMNLAEAMDKLIGEGRTREMIVVMPNARNRYHGSHYVNSEVTGGWADAIARDLVSYIDHKYRTIASPRGRGLAGWSMGGRGAIYLAMMYPGVFGSVYGLSSGYFDFDRFPPVTDEEWQRVLSVARSNPDAYEFKVPEQIAEIRAISLSTAFSPNPQGRPFLCDVPVELADGKLQTIPTVWRRWLNHDPIVLLRSQGRNLRRLRALQFDCGRSDLLLDGNRTFARALDAAGIRHTFEEFDGTHVDHLAERITTRLLPFFSRTLRN